MINTGRHLFHKCFAYMHFKIIITNLTSSSGKEEQNNSCPAEFGIIIGYNKKYVSFG